MKTKQPPYLLVLGLHVLLAFVIYTIPFLSKVYGVLIPFFGTILLINTKNRNNEALLVAAYVISSEVLLRMTGGNIAHELAKYEVIYFLLLGMFFSGTSKNSIIYLVFILLLLPGIYIGANVLSYEVNVRKAILFNILGEVTLFFSAIYCYQRRITFDQIKNLIDMLAYPLMATLVYMYLYTPSVKDVVTNTESNFETSGGFGPNQVSTILGLGIFLFFVKIVLISKTAWIRNINILFFIVITFFYSILLVKNGFFLKKIL